MVKRRARAPRSHKKSVNFKKKGLIIVHTGGGKGKTTSAFGTALRALGRGYRVAVVQFMKGRWRTGEIEAAKKFGRCFKILSFGEGFTWETKSFKKDVKTARRAWCQCVKFLRDRKHQLVVFDEINYCLQYRFLNVDEIIKNLKRKPSFKHVILTGNGAPKKLVRLADLVTEMKCIKHPYRKGILAQPGIEY